MTEDFGEKLVKLRDDWERRPPAKVNACRVFFAVFVEVYVGDLAALLFRRHRMDSLRDPPRIQQEVEHLNRTLAAELDGTTPTQQQIEQFEELVQTEMARRSRLINREYGRWIGAARSAVFLGLLVHGLLLASICLSIPTIGPVMSAKLGLIYLLTRVVALLILHNGWHRYAPRTA